MKFPCHKFHELKYHLLGQTFLYIFFMGFVLFVMGWLSNDSVEWAVGASSLASSAYGVFVLPRSLMADPKRILLGYFVASAVGLIFHLILGYFSLRVSAHLQMIDSHLFWVLSALAVVVTMLLMMLLGAQHPPAAGIALSMASDAGNGKILCAIWISVLVLVLIRLIFSRYLRDLVE